MAVLTVVGALVGVAGGLVMAVYPPAVGIDQVQEATGTTPDVWLPVGQTMRLRLTDLPNRRPADLTGAEMQPTRPLAAEELRLVACPQCGNPATATTHATMASTDGPVRMLRVACLARHWYLMPAGRLTDLGGSPTGTT